MSNFRDSETQFKVSENLNYFILRLIVEKKVWGSVIHTGSIISSAITLSGNMSMA